MKKYTIIIILFASLKLFNSCQEAIYVPLDTASPKIVIEAALNWQKGTSGNVQNIKLTTTTNFYSNAIPTVSGAVVTVSNSTNAVFNFVEIGATGVYQCNNFIPVLNEQYKLNINVNGQSYSATENLKSVAPINTIVQEEQTAFGRRSLKIRALFNDPPIENNFYLYKFKFSDRPTPEYNTDEDKFFQGNPFFSLTFDDKIKAGDVITFTHFGISKSYFNYMSILLSVAGSNNGGPFQSPPATVKGNIKNNTNFDNFPLGYFSVSEIDIKSYTIQ
jgi:hypothetical protein